MENLLLIKEAAAQAQRSEESVRAIIRRAKLQTGELFGRMAVYAKDMPIIKSYPRSNRRTKAEIERMKNAQADVEFAENFGAEPMQLNEAKVPANAKQPIGNKPAQGRIQTLSINQKPKTKLLHCDDGYKFGGVDENGNIIQVLVEHPKTLEEIDCSAADYTKLHDAAEVLARLAYARNKYNDEWKCNWSDRKQQKSSIYYDAAHRAFPSNRTPNFPVLFAFKDEATRNEFCEHFKEQIQQVAILFS